MIGLYLFTFGPSYSYLLIGILYGPNFTESEAPFVLQVYCIYVGFMAINGIPLKKKTKTLKWIRYH